MENQANGAALDQVLVEGEMEVEYVQASSGKRFLNMIIDTIAYYVIAVVILVVLMLGVDANPDDKVTTYLITALCVLSYYTILEATTGRTLGKLITGTKVVTEDGKIPSWGKALGRSASRLVPLEPFSFLAGRGWHDSWTDTYVIDLKKKPTD